MKNYLVNSVLFSFLFVSLFTSCSSDDDDDNVYNLTLETYSADLEPGETASISILSGNGNYQVVTNNDDVATARISGNNVVISAIGEGTASLTVSDAENKFQVIQVMVKASTTALTSAEAFHLGRPEQDGFPSSAMGITWSRNTDSNTAEFSTVAIEITQAQYNQLQTKEAVKELYDSTSNKIASFTAKSDANFSEKYFIVNDAGTYRLVKMVDLTFDAGANKAYFVERH